MDVIKIFCLYLGFLMLFWDEFAYCVAKSDLRFVAPILTIADEP